VAIKKAPISLCAIRPVSHGLIPFPSVNLSSSLYLNNLDNDNNAAFEPQKIEPINNNSKPFDQSAYNNLIRDLGLSKEDSELLDSTRQD